MNEGWLGDSLCPGNEINFIQWNELMLYFVALRMALPFMSLLSKGCNAKASISTII